MTIKEKIVAVKEIETNQEISQKLEIEMESNEENISNLVNELILELDATLKIVKVPVLIKLKSWLQSGEIKPLKEYLKKEIASKMQQKEEFSPNDPVATMIQESGEKLIQSIHEYRNMKAFKVTE